MNLTSMSIMSPNHTMAKKTQTYKVKKTSLSKVNYISHTYVYYDIRHTFNQT